MSNDLQSSFIAWCITGNLEEIKRINFKENKLDINPGFTYACEHGHLKIVKHLLLSSYTKDNIDIHANNDLAFKWAASYNQEEMLKFFIIEHKILKTKAIEKAIYRNENKMAKNLFDLRDLRENLQNTLPTYIQDVKSLKL